MISKKISRFARLLLDGIAPLHCVLCRMRCTGYVALCDACQDELPANQPACPTCALPLAEPDLPCGSCQRNPRLFARAIAPQRYEMPISELIAGLKFRRDTSLVPVLAHLMAPTLHRHLQHHRRPDLLIPAPLHRWRQLRRGFNQAQLLAQALVRHPLLQHQELVVNARICHKTRNTPPQAGLQAHARRANLAGAFQCRPLTAGTQVAIVDDVLTTGSTANALASTLLEAGAAGVEVWACARAPQPGTE